MWKLSVASATVRSTRDHRPRRRRRVATYRLHDHTGDDLGVVEHPAPNLEPGDVVMLEDGREALVTCRVETLPGPLEAMLEVVVGDGTRRASL